MSEDEPQGEHPEFGSLELVKIVDVVLQIQAQHLEVLWKLDLNERTSMLRPLIEGVRSNCLALSYLAKGGFLNESYMVARAFVERVINACYLLVCDEDELEAYLQYSHQKGFRTLSRQVSAGDSTIGLKYEHVDKVEKSPELQAALDRFTSKRGREITRWTTKNPVDRLEIVADRTNLDITGLLLAWLSIWEKASEALHGTLYGCVFHLGFYEPGSDFDDAESFHRHMRGSFTSLLMLIGGAIPALLYVVGELNPDARELARLSEQDNQEFVKDIAPSLGLDDEVL